MRDGALADRPRDLLVSGHVNVDRFLRLPRFPDADRTVPVLAERVEFGGTAGHLAVAAARFGIRAGLIARVGDGFPPEFRVRLARAGIDLRGLTTLPRVPTPTAYILEDAHGGQRTLLQQGAMADGLRASRATPSWISEYSWVHLTTGPPEIQLALEAAARRAGVPVAVDPAQEVHYRWTATRLRRFVTGAEILFGNRSEIDRVAERLGAGRSEDLLEHVPMVVRTEGKSGATAFTRAGTVHVPARRPRRIRTVVGAGDHFRAGFYAAWFEGEPLPGCLEAGIRSATRALEGAG
ncbi:MAG TPA: carbohydrate kinase family protein [Thermoplasmata archaeon]|nr:carbohydrate kinase family protein [Thermoplasmata archaeon]